MVDKHFRDEPDIDSYDDDVAQPRTRRYAFGRSADYDSVPLFLSDPDSEPDPAEFSNPLRPRGASVSLRILMGVIAASAVAVLFAWFTSDATRDLLVSAKASLSTVLPLPSTAAQAEASPPAQAASTQLTTRDVQLKDPARWQTPAAQTQTPPTVRGPQVAMAPSREDITNAYQSALQSRAAPTAAAAPPPAAVAPPVAAAPAVGAVPPVAPPPAAAPPARQLDPEEVALLMKRARDMLGTGDIPPARLLLRRAADAGEPNAALLLAQTYDPDVLGTQDVRNINPDIAMARTWYQRAAQLGSADAQRRLAQLQN
jgi:hypothetical protein